MPASSKKNVPGWENEVCKLINLDIDPRDFKNPGDLFLKDFVVGIKFERFFRRGWAHCVAERRQAPPR